LIDEIYLRSPYYGARRIAAELNRMDLGIVIDRKRVGRLMEEMGIEALYPKPKLSRSDKGHVKYPYLLKGVDIERKNQVWGTDITYVPTKKRHVYATPSKDTWITFQITCCHPSPLRLVNAPLMLLTRLIDILTVAY
jgi:putative transposase